MSSATDISNLFQMVGGNPSQYHETERAEQVHGSRGRWSRLTVVQPDYVAAAPVDETQDEVVQDEAACAPEAVAPVDIVDTVDAIDTAEPISVEPQRSIECALSATASEPPPVLQAVPEQPVAQSTPEPVAAVQPAALGSVFARLLERKGPADDVPQRKTP